MKPKICAHLSSPGLRWTSLCLAVVPILLLASAAKADNAANLSVTIASAFARCQDICKEIEEIRELSFTNKVAMDTQSLENFEKYVLAEIEKQYGDRKAREAYVNALVKLGALKEKMDLDRTFVDFFRSQAAAHYDPKSKKYLLLMTNMPNDFLDMVSSHELCHALQDQHFDLNRLIMDGLKEMTDNSDKMLARQALGEGDATIVMTAWAVIRQTGASDPKEVWHAVSVAIGAQAAMDFDTILDVAERGSSAMKQDFGSMGSIEDMKKCPRFFSEGLLAAYLQGAAMVDRVKRREGWKGVDALYTNPPESTEQILHPTKLRGKRDLPVDVRMKDMLARLPGDWKMTREDVMGELGIRIFFEIWLGQNATDEVGPLTASEGWGGDRFYYLENAGAGTDALVWKTVWDLQEDAREFLEAYIESLRERFPSLEKKRLPGKNITKGALSWVIDKSRVITVTFDDKTVTIVDAPDPRILDAVNSR